MRLPGRLNKEKYDALDTDGKKHYEKDEDRDVWYLKEGETENVDGLKSALSHEKEQSTSRQKALDLLKDIDPEKYKTLLAEEQSLAKQRDEVSKQVAATTEQWEKKLEKETKKLSTRSSALYSALEEALIDRTLLASAGGKVLTPKIWLRAAKDHVRLVETEDPNTKAPTFKVEVIDPDTKAPKLSEKSKGPMSTEELVDHLATLEDFKPLYRSSGAAGSGAGGQRPAIPGTGGAPVISREDAKDPAKYRAVREESIKAGHGLPTIEPLPNA